MPKLEIEKEKRSDERLDQNIIETGNGRYGHIRRARNGNLYFFWQLYSIFAPVCLRCVLRKMVRNY